MALDAARNKLIKKDVNNIFLTINGLERKIIPKAIKVKVVQQQML